MCVLKTTSVLKYHSQCTYHCFQREWLQLYHFLHIGRLLVTFFLLLNTIFSKLYRMDEIELEVKKHVAHTCDQKKTVEKHELQGYLYNASGLEQLKKK